MSLRENVQALAAEAAESRSCSLYDVYAHRDRFQALIERPASKPPATVKDCERVFLSLSFLLKSEIPDFFKKWRLEVSTPGVERRLRMKRHFKESIGCEVKIQARSPLRAFQMQTQKERHVAVFSGRLISFEKETAKLINNGTEWSAPFEEIKTAQRVFAWPEKSFHKKRPLKRRNGPRLLKK